MNRFFAIPLVIAVSFFIFAIPLAIAVFFFIALFFEWAGGSKL